MDNIKYNVVKHVLKILPKDGIIVLGAGSTINLLIDELGRTKSKLSFISASSSTSMRLNENNLNELPYSKNLIKSIKLMIDGADKVLFNYNNNIFIKGKGGALTSEKILWKSSSKIFVLVDETKLIKSKYYQIPIEILPFSYPLVPNILKELFGDNILKLELRVNNSIGIPFISDHGNYIIDLKLSVDIDFSLIEIHELIKTQVGIIETGIFYESTDKVTLVVGFTDTVKII